MHIHKDLPADVCRNFIPSNDRPEWQIDGETVETVAGFILGGSKILQMVTAAMKLKDVYSLEGKFWPT